MHFKKKPVKVSIQFAEQGGALTTLEGVVKYDSGDALATGVSNERWPILRSRFEKTYAPIPPTKMGENGWYSKKPILVKAYQVKEGTEIPLSNGLGILNAKKDDWVVSDNKGARWVVANTIFLETYELF